MTLTDSFTLAAIILSFMSASKSLSRARRVIPAERNYMHYRGIWIDTDSYFDLVTVQFDGDDVVFDTVHDAQCFIDEVIYGGE